MSDLQVGALRGFRLFRTGLDGSLGSYSADYYWSPGPNEAACHDKRQRHDVPATACGCGFWIYNDLRRCALTFRSELLATRDGHNRYFDGFEPRPRAILGQARGWGRVLEGESGWRTQFAAVDALLDIGQAVDLTPMADRYDVPVVAYPLDLSLVRSGILTARDDAANGDNRVGVVLDDVPLWVSMDTPAFFDLWRIQLGTAVEIHLDPRTGDVARVITKIDQSTDASG